MIRLVGIVGAFLTADFAAANGLACPPDGIMYSLETEPNFVIIPECLGDPEDIGKALGFLARHIIEVHQQQNPDQSYVAVEEVLVESFVSEILEPSVPAN